MTLTLDIKRHEVRVSKRPVRLTPREFEILRVLIWADGEVLSREKIMEWVGMRIGAERLTVDQHVSRIRRKLCTPAIETVSYYGYKILPGARIV